VELALRPQQAEVGTVLERIVAAADQRLLEDEADAQRRRAACHHGRQPDEEGRRGGERCESEPAPDPSSVFRMRAEVYAITMWILAVTRDVGCWAGE
jgi:hypothetical protein